MKHSASAAPRLLTSSEYIEELIKHIEHATQHVTVFTMIITDDESTDALIDALCAAAGRGVSVHVTSDIYTYGVMSAETDGRWWANRGIKATRRMERRFTAGGVDFRWVGELGPLVYAQRTHVKWCLVDDVVFSFGGINLYRNGINSTDYMIMLRDVTLAERLKHEHLRIHRSERMGNRQRSHSFSCSAGEVLVDGGMFGSSIIYRHACELARQASHIVFVSQYRPSGQLARLLAKTDSRLYFNRWQDAFGANKIWLFLTALFNRQQTRYRRKRYLHAKFIIFTLPGGHKVALTGSHNFVRGGVWLGTREIALETHNPDLIAQLEAFYKKHIA